MIIQVDNSSEEGNWTLYSKERFISNDFTDPFIEILFEESGLTRVNENFPASLINMMTVAIFLVSILAVNLTTFFWLRVRSVLVNTEILNDDII